MAIFSALKYIPFVLLGLNFLISGIVVNFINFIVWLIVRPWNLWLYRKITYYATYIVWGQLVFIPEWYSSSTLTIYTDDDTWSKMGKEHAVVVLNHSYEVDWVLVLLMGEVSRVLGNCKAFVKKSLKWTPVAGWTANLSESIYVERNWEKDKVNIERQLQNLGSFPDPVWVTIFAEGTRFTPEKHAASVEFANKAGLPPLEHLLLPRTRGFVLTADQLRGKFPAVYSCTLVFNTKDGAPSFQRMVFGRPAIAEILIERIPLEEIPADPDKASDWLHESFRQKDRLIDAYKKEGQFPSTLTGHFKGPIRAHYRPRRLWILLITLCSSWLTLPPIVRGIYVLLCSGILNITLVLVLLGLLYVGLQKLVALSSTSSGSAYGSDSPRSKST